ncbi:hypothetical protein JW960_11410 [candidate division KSB1 bacterium]|nr:hypothetical protein [candidate division KSB1 bacterium]
MERKSRQYSDLGVTYFQRHTYRISAYTANYESPLSDTVSIIPGPSVVWITDAYNYRLIKLSYDCTHEISSISANGYPWAIAWNQINQSLWYTDLLLGHVYTYGMSNLQYYNSHSLIWDPVSIGLDETRNVAWIADANGKIIQIRPDLPSPVQEIESSFIEQPESIAIDNRRHYCWIADPGTRHVIKLITTDLTLIPSSATFQKPNAVAVNTTNGQCWVADSSRVIALSSRGDSIAVIYDSYNDALNIAINNVTGDIWVIDRLAADGSARLLRYDFAGNHQVEVSGLLKPTGIVVDESTNDCLITDSWNQRVLRISQSGNILFSNSKNLYFPAGIAIIYNDN